MKKRGVLIWSLITLVALAVIFRLVLPRAVSSPLLAQVVNLLIAAAVAVVLLMALKWVPFLRSFWGTAFLSLVLISILWTGGLLGSVPVFGSIWLRGDASAAISVMVLFVVVWCLAVLTLRFSTTQKELSTLHAAREKLLRKHDPLERSDVEGFLSSRSDWDHEKGRVYLRLRLLLDNCAVPARATQLLSEQGGVEAAHLQSAYGPLRALVWSLPALGFIGTAAAMASSIKGVGATLGGGGNAGNEQIQFFLTSHIIPSLADAFGITLVALSSTIFCFFLLSLMYEREEWLLNHTEELALQLLSKIENSTLLNPANPSDQLLAELWSLEQEISKLSGQFQQLLDGRGFSATLSASLAAVYTELRRLRLGGNEARKQAHGSSNGTKNQDTSGNTDSLLRDIVAELKQLNELMRVTPQKEAASANLGSDGLEPAT